MPTVGLGNSQKSFNITWLDITLISSITILWFFLAQVWTDRLAVLMFGLSGIMLAIYFTARYTGALAFMRLSIPTWTISGLVSLVVWPIYLGLVPSASSTLSSTSEEISNSLLSSFLGTDFVVRLLQIFMFPFTESLFVIFIFALFMGIAIKRFNKDSKATSILPLVLVSSFGSIIHTSVAKSFEKQISFVVSLSQQFVSFLFMAFMGIFFLAPAIISTHMTKNLIVLGDGIWFIIIFGFFIAMDLASIFIFGEKPRETFKKRFT